jgi:hypothetical protein
MASLIERISAIALRLVGYIRVRIIQMHYLYRKIALGAYKGYLPIKNMLALFTSCREGVFSESQPPATSSRSEPGLLYPCPFRVEVVAQPLRTV